MNNGWRRTLAATSKTVPCFYTIFNFYILGFRQSANATRGIGYSQDNIVVAGAGIYMRRVLEIGYGAIAQVPFPFNDISSLRNALVCKIHFQWIAANRIRCFERWLG